MKQRKNKQSDLGIWKRDAGGNANIEVQKMLWMK